MPKGRTNSASIGKLYDNPQTGDRIVFDTGTTFSEQIITVEGSIVRSSYNDGGIGALSRSIERIISGADTPDSDPFEMIESIESFRERILACLGIIRTAILVPRESEKYEMDSGIIDELYDNPTPGDRMEVNLIHGGDLRFERTITRDGDIIGFKESEVKYTIEKFRTMIKKTIEEKRLMAVSLAIRHTKHNVKTVYPDKARIAAFAQQIYELEMGTKKAVDDGVITMRELEIAHYINAWTNENLPEDISERRNQEKIQLSKLQDGYLIAAEIFGISDYEAEIIFEKVSKVKRTA